MKKLNELGSYVDSKRAISIGRRDFLVISGGLVSGLFVSCGQDQNNDRDDRQVDDDLQPGEVDAGPLAELGAETIRFVDQGPLVVVRDSTGLYAMSALCTHQQCTGDDRQIDLAYHPCRRGTQYTRCFPPMGIHASQRGQQAAHHERKGHQGMGQRQ